MGLQRIRWLSYRSRGGEASRGSGSRYCRYLYYIGIEFRYRIFQSLYFILAGFLRIYFFLWGFRSFYVVGRKIYTCILYIEEIWVLFCVFRREQCFELIESELVQFCVIVVVIGVWRGGRSERGQERRERLQFGFQRRQYSLDGDIQAMGLGMIQVGVGISIVFG